MEQLAENPYQPPSMARRSPEPTKPSRKFVPLTALVFAVVTVVFAVVHLMLLFQSPVISLTWYVWLCGILPIVVVFVSAMVAVTIEFTASRRLKVGLPIFLWPSLAATAWFVAATFIELAAGAVVITTQYLLLSGLRAAVCGVAWFYFLTVSKRKRALRIGALGPLA